MKRNCDMEEQEVQAQIRKHKQDKEKILSYPDTFYSYNNPVEQKNMHAYNPVFITKFKNQECVKTQ